MACALFPLCLSRTFFLVLAFHPYYDQFPVFFHLSPHSHVLHCLTENSCGKVKHPEKFSNEESIKKKSLWWCISFLFLFASRRCCFLIDFDSDLPVTSCKPIPRMKHTTGYVFLDRWCKIKKKKKKGKVQEKGQ